MSRVTVIGSDGMLGRVLCKVLFDQGYEVNEINRRGIGALPNSSCLKFDPLNMNIRNLHSKVRDSDYVVNCLGVIKHRIDEQSLESIGKTFLVNSVFPRELVHLCADLETALVSIGTDCVFSGSKGGYNELMVHDATDVYGISKSAGELAGPHHCLIRTSFVGLNDRYHKEFLDWVLHLPRGAIVEGFRNHRWNGLTTLHVSRLINGMIRENERCEGVFHVIPNGSVSKAQMVRLVSTKFGRNDLEVVERDSQPPIDRTLSTSKPDQIRHFWELAGYEEAPTFEQMLEEFAHWSLHSGHNDSR